MDFEELLSSPALWVLSGIGYIVFFFMNVILKGMGDADFMPFWIKLTVCLLIPVISGAVALIMGD